MEKAQGPTMNLSDEVLAQVKEAVRLTGGRVNYYLVYVTFPQREEQQPYQAECEDIIEALGLTFDEANIFKEIWRTANARTHGNAKVGHEALYGAEKISHYAGRILKQAQIKATTKPAREYQWHMWDGNSKIGPVADGKKRIEVELRNGVKAIREARNWHWEYVKPNSPSLSDITRWRLTDEDC